MAEAEAQIEEAEAQIEEAEAQIEETVEINTLIGKGSGFTGKLTFQGAVRIDGEFSGEIFSDDILVVGEGGLVKAEIEIGSLVVEGVVEGNIHAKRSVEIHAPGTVKGNIVTPSLFIDRGVVFEGNCQMYDAEEGPPKHSLPKSNAAEVESIEDTDHTTEPDVIIENTKISSTTDA